MRGLGLSAAALCALAACGSDEKFAADAQEVPQAPRPVRATGAGGGFTWFGVDGGMPGDVWDASADEGGNVYVAAGDAILARKKGAAEFLRFDLAAAGVTPNCDAGRTVRCPAVSIAGSTAGVAVVGLRGLGTDGDSDPDWWLDSGGADVLAFDGAKLSRLRHVHVAGMPRQFCMDYSPPPCSTGDATYEKGRRKVRQVLRLAVDHRPGDHHGDVWMAGTHGAFSLLVAKPDRRGWTEPSPRLPGTDDRRFVWEHDHPAITTWAVLGGVRQLAFLAGTSTALALDPRTGDPWAANETRLATKRGAGSRADGWNAEMWPPWRPDEVSSHLDVWPDPKVVDPRTYDALDHRWMDATSSLSFCDDGTLWIASHLHGLARLGTDGAISYVGLPDGTGNSASAVACDPDGGVWVGFGWGGFGRYDGGWWTVRQAAGAPAWAVQAPVRSIQLDRSTSPRTVWFAHAASRLGPGGLTAFAGGRP